jgi:short-subunit dehydrogenase
MNILITGASKGIGHELALEFAKHGNTNLFLISRSKIKLEQLAIECYKINRETEVTIIPFDIVNFVNNDFPDSLNFPHLDILINNAGLLIKKEFSDFNGKDILALTQVNFIAPAMLIKHFVEKMGGESPTHVINIGSMGGFQGSLKFKGLSIYSATKAALASLTESLAAEYNDRNIFFNCLALGAVQTEMLKEAFPGYIAPLTAKEIAVFIYKFAVDGYRFFNGKILPLSVSTP